MARHISAGIDIGTFQIKVVLAEEIIENGKLVPKIVGTGLAEARGMERGYITDPSETARSVRSALTQAEKTAGVRVKRAYFSIGGVGLSSISTTGSTANTRADLEITERELEQVMESAESNIPTEALTNRKLINSIPLEYKIDGQPAYGRVEGLKAQKLEVRALFLTAVEHHLQDVIKMAELAKIEVIDIISGPVASSFVTLNKRQKKAGCILIDIGAETLSVVVYENDNLTSLEVFPVGGSDLTNDIALGLKISLEDAESVKRGGLIHATYSKKNLDEIIFAGLSDMFELVNHHLEEIGRDALLPAGAMVTGGGASMSVIREFTQEALQLPSQIAEIHFGNHSMGRIKDNIWSTACGLAIVGFNMDDERLRGGEFQHDGVFSGTKKALRQTQRLISQFLP